MIIGLDHTSAHSEVKLSHPFVEDLHIAEVSALGTTFQFLLNNRNDHIQGFIDRGEFYEAEELELICKHAPRSKRLLDIGANIGSHSIYLAHRLNLERVVPIEPQPAVLHLLKANLGLNWRSCFDLSYLGMGLADTAGFARIGDVNQHNLGGTRLVIDDTKRDPDPTLIRLETGDRLFRAGEFDLVKIDVEGMELAVLKGLRGCLSEFDGLLFVEVHDANVEEVSVYLDREGWGKVAEHRRYQKCSNWLLKRS